MDETTTEYPSQDYRQIDKLIEERKHLREWTPRRDLDRKNYQPRRLVEQRKIDLGLPRTAWTPHRDPASHEIYPIPEDEEERGSNNKQHTPGPRGNAPTRERTSRSAREPDPPPMEVKVLEEVLEPQEEEEEMNPATLEEMKDQIRMKVPIPKRKKMKVVSLQQG